jgi:hypothetical protein
MPQDATNCGERLGLGVTLVLAIEVTKIVIQELLPVCGEMLWIEVLLTVSEQQGSHTHSACTPCPVCGTMVTRAQGKH